MDETGDMSELSKVQNLFEKWSNEYFADEDEDEGRLHRFFASKDVPVYAKRSIINIANQKRGTTPLQQCASYQNFQKYIDVPEDPSILHSVKQSVYIAANEYERRAASPYKDDQYQNLYILGGAQFDGTVPDNSSYAFRKAVSEANRAEMIRLSKTFRLARGATKFANDSAKKILNRCLSVVASPTTTDYEAKGIVMAFKRATMKYSSKLKRDLVKPSDDYIAKEMERLVPESALREIEARTGEDESSSSGATQPPPAPTPDVPAPTEEKPQAPMTESGKGTKDVSYAKTADDFLKICDEVRNEIMTPEEAERDRQEAKVFLDNVNSKINARIIYEEAREMVMKTRRKYGTNSKEYFMEALKYEVKKEAFIAARKKVLQTYHGEISESKMEHIKGTLRSAFPDNKGKSFFTQEYKDEVLSKGRSYGIEKELQYMFDFFDLIGRAYNTSGREFVAPKFEFVGRNPKDCGGYLPRRNVLEINVSMNDTIRKELRGTVIHEMAHWLEVNAIGDDAQKENAEWLIRKTGYSRNGIMPYIIPIGKNPNLCVSHDGYAMKIYPRLLSRNPKGEDSVITTTDVFSEAMQYLAYFPEMFASRSPEHLERSLSELERIRECNWLKQFD